MAGFWVILFGGPRPLLRRPYLWTTTVVHDIELVCLVFDKLALHTDWEEKKWPQNNFSYAHLLVTIRGKFLASMRHIHPISAIYTVLWMDKRISNANAKKFI